MHGGHAANGRHDATEAVEARCGTLHLLLHAHLLGLELGHDATEAVEARCGTLHLLLQAHLRGPELGIVQPELDHANAPEFTRHWASWRRSSTPRSARER